MAAFDEASTVFIVSRCQTRLSEIENDMALGVFIKTPF